MKHVEGKLAEAIRELQSDASAKLCIIFDSFSVSPAEAESSVSDGHILPAHIWSFWHGIQGKR